MLYLTINIQEDCTLHAYYGRLLFVRKMIIWNGFQCFIIKSHIATTKNASGSKLQYSVLCETKDISYFKLARMIQVAYTLCNQTYIGYCNLYYLKVATHLYSIQ